MKSEAIMGAVQGVTKKWAKQRKREEREASAARNRRYVMTRSYHVSIKDAAWRFMEEAYLKASADGTLPALARQIMYAARPNIMRVADRELGHFGQSLDTILSQQRADRDEPVILVLHMTCPRVEYTDRGKSAVVVRS